MAGYLVECSCSGEGHAFHIQGEKPEKLMNVSEEAIKDYVDTTDRPKDAGL